MSNIHVQILARLEMMEIMLVFNKGLYLGYVHFTIKRHKKYYVNWTILFRDSSTVHMVTEQSGKT